MLLRLEVGVGRRRYGTLSWDAQRGGGRRRGHAGRGEGGRENNGEVRETERHSLA